MSTKTIKKELVAALIMTLVAMLALGSSTYAWFANNLQAKADGLSVSAKMDSLYMYISASSSDAATIQSEKNTSVTLTAASPSSLYPAHYSGAAGSTATSVSSNWYTALGDKPGSSAVKSGTEASLTDATFTNYVVHRTVWLTIAKGSKAVTSVTCSASLTNATGTDATTILITTPGASQNSILGHDGTASGSLGGINSDTDVLQVDIFVFIEGTHSSVYTENYSKLESTGIELTFNGAEAS